MTEEYTSGPTKRAGALRSHLLKQFFYLRTGLTERGLSAFCTGNFTLPLATISSSSSSARTKKNKELNFLRRLNKMTTLKFISQEEKMRGGGGSSIFWKVGVTNSWRFNLLLRTLGLQQ